MFIEFLQDWRGDKYVVGYIENGITYYVTKDLALTRVEAIKAFVRDYNKATYIAGLLFKGRLKEGVPFGLLD